MEDYRLEQTGPEVQSILNGAAMDANLQAEVERATEAEGRLQGNIDSEERARQDADGLLQQGISDEENRAKRAEEANAGDIADIKALIPSTATPANKLADTDYVNSSIQTATATYRGNYNLVTDLHLAIDATHAQIETLLGTVIAEADNNDYCYVMVPTSAETPTQIAKIERYKFNGTAWAFEYDVNNSGYTAAQWAAINSGITSGLVAKLNALPTNTDLLALLAGKQDVLTFDDVPVEGSNNVVKSGGVHSAIDDEKTARVNNVNTLQGEIDGIEGKIPSGASSANKLVDTATMESAVSTATATFRGDYNLVSDLHLAIDATHAQIATMLASEISTADNNDYAYVEIPTNAETPAQIARVERYKFNGTEWGYEYTLNNSGFTANQWAAINSMITSGLVDKLTALPTNADLLALLAQKQDVLTWDQTPTENSTHPVTSGGVYAADKALSDAIEAILLLIPSAATSLNKLVDQALMNSSISTATATFRGTYNLVSDLSLGIDATEQQIAAALALAISTADNNDYAFVQIPTSAETPAQIARTDRYKYNGTAWAFEYTLNTSGFTAAQWAAINSGIIAAMIPSEATALNPLADKAYVLAQILAATPAFKGQFTTLAELQAVASPKAGDLGIVRTKDSDGMDVFTFYQYLNNQWNVFYTQSYHPQTKPATTGTTGDYPYNGMGRVDLPKNMVNTGTELEPVMVNTLTQDMFYKGAVGSREPNTNTIFVIKYDYVLGEDITVPENCILEFEGGSISGNNAIDLNNCLIKAPNSCIFNGVTIQGTTNDIFNLCWLIDDSDITDVINSLPNTIKKIVFVSDKTYYVHNTVTFTSITYLDWNANVYYNGTISNISVVKLVSCVGAKVNFTGWLAPIDDTTAIDQVNDNTNVVGLEIVNTCDSTLYIANIAYFNENVRLSGVGAGCCENKLFFGRLYCANRHLRIYQKNVDNNIGWTNENYFYGGHFFNFSSWTNQGKKSCAIHIQGAGREGDTDTYDHCNALTFREFNLEGYSATASNGYTIYGRNIQNCAFLRIRNEGGVHLIKLVNDCRNISLESTYGPEDAELTDCTRAVPLAIGAYNTSIILDNVQHYLKPSGDNRKASELICFSDGSFSGWQTGTDFNGISFDYSQVAGSIITIKISSGIAHVCFIKSGVCVEAIPRKAPFIFYSATTGYSTSSGTYTASILIPTGLNVDTIAIGGVGNVKFSVYCTATVIVRTQYIPTEGTYANRPTTTTFGTYGIPLGREYYCTDTKKKILWNGTAWVNMDGSALS